MDYYASIASRVSPAQWCQAVFVLLATGTQLINALPARTRRHLMDYGAREVKHDQPAPSGKQDSSTQQQQSLLERVTAAVAARSQVPHAWFASFYAAYLLCALGWFVQWWLWKKEDRGSNVFAWLVQQQSLSTTTTTTSSITAGTSLVQTCVVSILEAIQACRRLYEHFVVFPSSRSRMNIAHWVLGLAFYVCMSVAVWIEGSQAILLSTELSVPTPSQGIKLLVGTSLFSVAWISQYQCHVYLAGLKKYSLPEEGLFRRLVCPHYTCECLLYLSLSIAAAPAGQLLNQTLLSGVFFVVLCLGVTASRTKTWYGDKFGRDRVASKWKMIPFVF